MGCTTSKRKSRNMHPGTPIIAKGTESLSSLVDEELIGCPDTQRIYTNLREIATESGSSPNSETNWHHGANYSPVQDDGHRERDGHRKRGRHRKRDGHRYSTLSELDMSTSASDLDISTSDLVEQGRSSVYLPAPWRRHRPSTPHARETSSKNDVQEMKRNAHMDRAYWIELTRESAEPGAEIRPEHGRREKCVTGNCRQQDEYESCNSNVPRASHNKKKASHGARKPSARKHRKQKASMGRVTRTLEMSTDAGSSSLSDCSIIYAYQSS